MKTHYYTKENSINALFLPGFPGEFKDRKLIDDLKSFGTNIYSIQYPGTYNKEGIFFMESCKDELISAINDLDKLNQPIILITYSFSTVLIRLLEQISKNIVGIIHFSPILDFVNGITEDFLDSVKSIAKDFDFKVDLNALESFNVNYKFKYLNAKIPELYFLGGKDETVNIDYTLQTLSEISKKAQNNLITFLPDASHKLDSQYDYAIVRNQILSLVISTKLRNEFDQVKAIYLWGSSLDLELYSNKSDLDLIIIIEKFSYELQQKINQYTKLQEQKLGKKIDLIVVSESELNRKKIIRRNRGDCFIDSLKYFCFPIIAYQNLRKVELNLSDYGRVFYSIIYQARKILQNFRNSSDQVEIIVKSFILNLQNYFFVTKKLTKFSDLIKYLEANEQDLEKLIKEAIEIKKNDYEIESEEILVKMLKVQEALWMKLLGPDNDWYFEEEK